MVPDRCLARLERYRRRCVAPRRAARAAYAPVFRAFAGLFPRPFVLAGPVRRWGVAGRPAEVVEALLGQAVFTLDSALELTGRRRWGPGADIWVYVSEWSVLESLEGGAGAGGPALLGRPRSGFSAPRGGALGGADSPVVWASWQERGVLLHACKPMEPVSEEPALRGHRVVSALRLVEDLLGMHGLRLDLFARLLEAWQTSGRGRGVPVWPASHEA